MKHLAVPSSENFPAIQEEGSPPQLPPSPSTTRGRQRNTQSFTTVTSDEIISAISENENESEEDDDQPLVMKQKLVPYAPDGGYGWVIVLAAFLSTFVLDGISVSQSVIMEDIRKSSGIVQNGSCTPPGGTNCTETVYEITVAMYGLISSVLLCVTLVAGPFISLMIDGYGFRKVAVSGSLLSATGLFLSWACSQGKPNIWAIIVCFGGMSGLGFGMMFQPAIVIVGMYFDKWRPLANGLAMMGTGCGTIIFPPLIAFISKTWSWREAYLFQGTVALLSASFALFYFPLPKRAVMRSELDASSKDDIIPEVSLTPPASEEQFGISSMFKSMRPLLGSPTFLLISVSGAITMSGFFGPYAFLVDKAMKEIHIDERHSTFLLSIIGIANTSGRLIFGLISCHPWVNSLVLSNGALTIAGIATILIPYTTAYYQLIIFCIIFGFGIAIFTVLRSILVLKLMGMDKFNNAFGLSLLFMGIGTLVGNPLGGWLKDSTGTYDITFYAAGGYLLLSGILCYPLQHVRDWENKGSAPLKIPRIRRELDKERFVQRRYSLSLSLHI